MSTYRPTCEATWATQCAGADEQSNYCERSVEAVLTELNNSLAALTEIERLPMPLDDAAQLRRTTHEYLAARAIAEAQAIQKARAVIARAAA